MEVGKKFLQESILEEALPHILNFVVCYEGRACVIMGDQLLGPTWLQGFQLAERHMLGPFRMAEDQASGSGAQTRTTKLMKRNRYSERDQQ